MKYIITERQYRLLSEEEEDKVDDPIESLKKSTNLVYNFDALSNDWDLVFRLAKGRPFIIEGDVNIIDDNINTLDSLVGVDGNLNLYKSQIQSLGDLKHVARNLYLSGTPIKTLGNLKSVGYDLYAYNSDIEDLKNLEFVGGNLYLNNTPLSKKTTRKEIRNIPNLTIKGKIFLV